MPNVIYYSAIEVVKILFGFLCLLHILNFYWLWMMVSGLLRRLKQTKHDKDNKINYKVE